MQKFHGLLGFEGSALVHIVFERADVGMVEGFSRERRGVRDRFNGSNSPAKSEVNGQMKSLRSKGLKLSLVLVVSTTCCTGHVYPCVSMNHRHRVVRVVNGC